MWRNQTGLSKILLISIIGGAVLALGGGGTAVMMMMRSPEPGEVATEGEEGATEEGSTADHAILSLDSFITNLAQPDSNKYLKCTLRVVMSSATAVEAVEADEILRVDVRDRVLTLLASKTLGDVTNPQGKEALRREITRELARAMPDEESVIDVKFAEFVVQ